MSSHLPSSGARGAKRVGGPAAHSSTAASASAAASDQQSKRARSHTAKHAHHAPTVRDLITDELAPLANQYWAPGADKLQGFEPAIIDNIYSQHLAPKNSKAQLREEKEAERQAAGDAAEPIDEEERRQADEEEEREQAQIEAQRSQRLLLLELSAYLEKSVHEPHRALGAPMCSLHLQSSC